MSTSVLHRGEEAVEFRSSACLRQPQEASILLVAVATPADEEGTLDVAVAQLGAGSLDVRAAYTWKVMEDADFRMAENSLRLVTTGYRLDTRTLAFGLDVTSGHIPHCADSGIGARRTLFASVRGQLLPVLQDIPMSSWAYISEPSSRCHWTGRPVRGITATYTTSIAVARNQGHSRFSDLTVTLRSARDDGKSGPSAPLTLRLPFEGEAYDSAGLRDTFERWSRLPAKVRP